MHEWLLDTNAISDLIKHPNGATARQLVQHEEQCFTSIIVVAELAFGLRKRPSLRREADISIFLGGLRIEAWKSPCEDYYARIRTALEVMGTPIGANDLFIAAHALALDATLVTANEREFRRVPGLRVENWAA